LGGYLDGAQWQMAVYCRRGHGVAQKEVNGWRKKNAIRRRVCVALNIRDAEYGLVAHGNLAAAAIHKRAGARNGPILTRCCARERVKRAIFAAL
jgi:hypothetical protein